MHYGELGWSRRKTAKESGCGRRNKDGVAGERLQRKVMAQIGEQEVLGLWLHRLGTWLNECVFKGHCSDTSE